ncbi:MAG: MipA/OmpV family protein [Sphingorhabdus sp.]|jgi:outer membrane scaffolding protein for murein synthesis (MipA/OmpV family)|nr:MipA/OmpV family protein [Sphingorhabdus sp.]
MAHEILTKSGKTACSISFCTALFLSTHAYAQEQEAQQRPPARESVFDGDYLTIGAGAVVGPSYTGSDDYTVSPIPVIIGSVAGIDFQPRGPGFAVDVISDKKDAKIDYILGPVAVARFDRHNSIKDDVVKRLGKLDFALELGGVAGIQVNRVLHGYDSLTAQMDMRWDVAGAHNGMIVYPSLTYFTPLSRSVAVSLSVSAEHIDDDFADYYFSIDPAGSTASGLPVFEAQSGWKNVGATLFTAIDLDGDVTNGGFSISLIGSYSRLLGDAKRSPVTSIRGSSNQFSGIVGIGYTF